MRLEGLISLDESIGIAFLLKERFETDLAALPERVRRLVDSLVLNRARIGALARLTEKVGAGHRTSR
jgi:hypothetical protein